MQKDNNYQSILHLFPRRSLLMEKKNQRLSCEIPNRTSDKTILNYSSIKKSSQVSILVKFCYEKICSNCLPENFRIDQNKNQEIDIDLLYPYDPFQKEVE